MAKKDLRAQMDAARAAAAFIGAAQEAEPEEAVAEPVAREKEAASKPARTAKATRARAAKKPAAASAPEPAMPDYFAEASEGEPTIPSTDARGGEKTEVPVVPLVKPKATRGRKPRKSTAEADAREDESASARMTAQVLVPMTTEQREHADLLASVMKITRAEVMRQALDEYWENHKGDLQAAVAAYEELIRKLMK